MADIPLKQDVFCLADEQVVQGNGNDGNHKADCRGFQREGKTDHNGFRFHMGRCADGMERHHDSEQGTE